MFIWMREIQALHSIKQIFNWSVVPKRGIEKLAQFDLNIKVERGQRAQQASLILNFGQPHNTWEREISEGKEICILEHEPELMQEYEDIISYFRRGTYPPSASSVMRQKLQRQSKPFLIQGETLYHTDKDGIQWQVLCKQEAKEVLHQCHDVVGVILPSIILQRKYYQLDTFGHPFLRYKSLLWRLHHMPTLWKENLSTGRITPYSTKGPIWKMGGGFYWPIIKDYAQKLIFHHGN
jgi:hypothetical protein